MLLLVLLVAFILHCKTLGHFYSVLQYNIFKNSYIQKEFISNKALQNFFKWFWFTPRNLLAVFWIGHKKLITRIFEGETCLYEVLYRFDGWTQVRKRMGKLSYRQEFVPSSYPSITNRQDLIYSMVDLSERIRLDFAFIEFCCTSGGLIWCIEPKRPSIDGVINLWYCSPLFNALNSFIVV